MTNKAGILRQALLAIAWTRAGRRYDDTPCIIQGYKCYGNTLRIMQRALYDSEQARSDEILVSARWMCLYEAFEATTGRLTSWINQNMGIARIIELRGPENCQDTLSRAVLESMRQNLMIVSLITRKTSFVATDEWCRVPWEGLAKPLDQRLYDHGFTLGHIFHKSDAMLTDHSFCANVQVKMFGEISDAYHSLAILNEDLFSMQGGKLNTLEATTVFFWASLFGIDLGFSIFTTALLLQAKQSILDDNSDTIRDPLTIPTSLAEKSWRAGSLSTFLNV